MASQNPSQIKRLVDHLTEALGVRVFDREGRIIAHQTFCTLPLEHSNYGTSTTYLTQQTHGHHYEETDGMGYYYFSPDNGKTICPIAIARRPSDGAASVVIVSPRGPDAKAAIEILYETVRAVGDFPFYVKNPPPYLSLYFASKSQTPVPWNAMAPFEDDTFPNVIVNIDHICDAVNFDNYKEAGPYRLVRQKLRALQNAVGDFSAFQFEDYDLSKLGRVEKIIKAFFKEKAHRGDLSKPEDYKNMSEVVIDWREDKQNVIRAILTHKGDDLGFVMAERIGNTNCFGIYATLALGRPWPYSELQTLLLLQKIQKLGGQFADIGGAETKPLQDFHRKFSPDPFFKDGKQLLDAPRRTPWIQLG